MNDRVIRKVLLLALLAFVVTNLLVMLAPMRKTTISDFAQVVTPSTLEEMMEHQMLLENTLEDMKMQLSDLYSRMDTTISQEDFVRAELEYFKLSSGHLAVQGEGIILLVTDSRDPLKKDQNPNTQLVHDADINILLSELQNAGAEALAVNGERVFFHRTKIICNGPTIRINERVYSQPFMIEAIGDRKALQAAIYATDGYTQLLRRSGIFVEANTSILLEIPPFEETLAYEYLQEAQP